MDRRTGFPKNLTITIINHYHPPKGDRTVDHIFFPQTTVVDATKALREKLTEIKGLGPETQYGLFLADEDPKKGVWLEPGRTLEHYLLRENVSTNFILFQYWTIFHWALHPQSIV